MARECTDCFNHQPSTTNSTTKIGMVSCTRSRAVLSCTSASGPCPWIVCQMKNNTTPFAVVHVARRERKATAKKGTAGITHIGQKDGGAANT